jgi:hypothetical protein
MTSDSQTMHVPIIFDEGRTAAAAAAAVVVIMTMRTSFACFVVY